MEYKCLQKLVRTWECVVDSIVEDGSTRTEDGKWRVLTDDLTEKYGIGNIYSKEIILAMLGERKEVEHAEQIGDEYFIDFEPEHCTFYRRQLFEPNRMRTDAVYALKDSDGEWSFFRTELAGGYSFAYEAAQLLREACATLPGEVAPAELMPLLISNWRFSVDGERLFVPITEGEFQYLRGQAESETAFCITLDMEHDTLRVENLPSAGECCLPELTIPLDGRGHTCYALHSIAAGPEACFSSDENMKMDPIKLGEKIFRETISHNLPKFREQSDALTQTAPVQGMQMFQ